MSEKIKLDFTDLQSCGSTNDELYALAQNGAPSGTVVTARTQTKGKGTKGRSFHSPEKTGAYMSVLVRGVENVNMLDVTPLAAVVVHKVLLEQLNINAKIKKINDIYLNGKKVCGILTQAQSKGKNVDFIIIGIGINLFKPEGGFPEELKDIATYILEEYSEEVRHDMIEKIALELVFSCAKLSDETFRNEIYDYYNGHLL